MSPCSIDAVQPVWTTSRIGLLLLLDDLRELGLPLEPVHFPAEFLGFPRAKSPRAKILHIRQSSAPSHRWEEQIASPISSIPTPFLNVNAHEIHLLHHVHDRLALAPRLLLDISSPASMRIQWGHN